jgi:hypothetical protein
MFIILIYESLFFCKFSTFKLHLFLIMSFLYTPKKFLSTVLCMVTILLLFVFLYISLFSATIPPHPYQLI